VFSDGSWAALVPANVPVHMQPIDVFGMTFKSETVWVSGAPGEQRVCGGCHESRTDTTVIQPGLSQAIAHGPFDLRSSTPRTQRASSVFTRDGEVGIPWDQALQPVLDKCTGCHNGVANAMNPSWGLMDPTTGATFTWVFDLRGGPANYGVGTAMFSGYSASHLSLLGPKMSSLEESGLVIVGNPPNYIEPGSARDSKLIQMLNPPQQFPTQDLNKRAFNTASHAEAEGVTLTTDEYYLLVTMADNGAQFYSRENTP